MLKNAIVFLLTAFFGLTPAFALAYSTHDTHRYSRVSAYHSSALRVRPISTELDWSTWQRPRREPGRQTLPTNSDPTIAPVVSPPVTPVTTPIIVLPPPAPLPSTGASGGSSGPTPVVPVSTTTTQTTPSTTPPSTPPATDLASAVEQLILTKLNVERMNNGLAPFASDTRLVALAREHSTDMLVNNYFDHSNLAGCSSSCRYDNAGYAYSWMGENIYMMSGYPMVAESLASSMVVGWMNSPGHRANILNGNFTNIGVGIAISGSKIEGTTDFSRPR